MKHFRFYCMINPLYESTIAETSFICNQLSTMYEYFFKSVKMGGTSTFMIQFGEKIQQKLITIPPIVNHFIIVEWQKIEALSHIEKANFILEKSKETIFSYAIKEQLDIKPFELVYEIIKNKKFKFREHFGKPVLSPNKQFKAQVYFEFEYENMGTYIDFTDKLGNLINRVQFTSSGYSVMSETIGNIKWIDENCVKIYFIQVPKTEADAEVNRKNYWLIKTDKSVEFKNISADLNDPQALHQLGIYYYEGKQILKDEKKGIELIKRSADLNYKHAIKWLIHHNL